MNDIKSTINDLAPDEMTILLIKANTGDKAALDQVISLLYYEIKDIAANKRQSFRNNHTLNTTAIVNEAWLKLHKADHSFANKKHFLSITAMAIKQILLDEVKSKKRIKRPNVISQELSDNHTTKTIEDEADWLYQLDQILTKLEQHSPRLAQVFNLKFFCGMTFNEIAICFDLSDKTVQRDWEKAKNIIVHTFNFLETQQ